MQSWSLKGKSLLGWAGESLLRAGLTCFWLRLGRKRVAALQSECALDVEMHPLFVAQGQVPKLRPVALISM